MSSRYQTPDLLKGIAVVLMVQVHLVELFATEQITLSTAGEILLFLGGPPVAPVFMAVFGYFLAMSKKSSKELLKRGVLIFLLGMGLNIALNAHLLFKITTNEIALNPLEYIFGVDILHLAGLTIVFFAFTKKWLLRNNIALLAICLVVSFLGKFLAEYTLQEANYVTAYFFGKESWSYFPLFPWLCYPLLGMLFTKIQPRIDFNRLHKHKTKAQLFLVSAIFLIFTIPYALKVSSDLPQYYHHGSVFFLWTLFFLLLFLFWMYQLERFAGKTVLLKSIKWLGQNVTVAYVIQWILIGNIATAIYKTVDSYWLLAVFFVSVLVVTCLLTFLYERYKTRLSK